MRILRMTPYLTIEEDGFTSKNLTGFGRTCWELSKNWPKEDEVYILTQQYKFLFPSRENIIFLRYTPLNILLNVEISDFKRSISFIIRYLRGDSKVGYRPKFIHSLQLIKTYCSKGYFTRIIQEIKPDVIHIHGITPSCFAFIDAARACKIPYVINIHGVVTPTNPSFAFNNNWERIVFNNFIQNGDCVIAISNGIFEYIHRVWGMNMSSENKYTVVNGTKYHSRLFVEETRINKFRDIFIQDTGKKYLLLSVGSITIDKGQRKIIEALSQLSSSILEKTILLIVGDGPDRIFCERMVSEFGLGPHIKFLGYIPNDKLEIFYAAADLFVLVSEAPGFSRMYWESFSQGTPAIASIKQLGILDVYSEDSMVLIEDFSPEKIAQGISRALNKNWDKTKISSRNALFSWKSRCLEYRKILEKVAGTTPVAKLSLMDVLITTYGKKNEKVQ